LHQKFTRIAASDLFTLVAAVAT